MADVAVQLPIHAVRSASVPLRRMRATSGAAARVQVECSHCSTAPPPPNPSSPPTCARPQLFLQVCRRYVETWDSAKMRAERAARDEAAGMAVEQRREEEGPTLSEEFGGCLGAGWSWVWDVCKSVVGGRGVRLGCKERAAWAVICVGAAGACGGLAWLHDARARHGMNIMGRMALEGRAWLDRLIPAFCLAWHGCLISSQPCAWHGMAWHDRLIPWCPPWLAVSACLLCPCSPITCTTSLPPNRPSLLALPLCSCGRQRRRAGAQALPDKPLPEPRTCVPRRSAAVCAGLQAGVRGGWGK